MLDCDGLAKGHLAQNIWYLCVLFPGHHLRTEINLLKVALSNLRDELKDVDVSNAKAFNAKIKEVNTKITECKLARAQARAIARELAAYQHSVH